MPGVAEELQNGASLATLKPLKIQADASAAQLTTYKPSYDLATAIIALDSSGMFEGPISLFALDPSPVETETERAITGMRSVTWKAVGETMHSFDVVEAIAKSRGVVKRTVFPVVLASALANKDSLKIDRKPLLAGHQFVFSWYLSMYKQLEEQCDSEVLRLLQCALTPTVQIRTNLSIAEKAKWSIQISAQKSDESLAIDNFPTCAGKAWVAIGLMSDDNSPVMNQSQKLKALQLLKLRFANMTVNKAMVAAMEKLNDSSKVNAKSHHMLCLIETEFGRDVMTSGYVKVKKVIEICEKEAGLCRESVADAVAWSLEYLYCSLALGQLKPSKVSQDMLEIGVGKTNVGIVLRSLACQEIVTNLIPSWVDDLPAKAEYDALKTSLKQILAHFGNFMRIYERFGKTQPADPSDVVEVLQASSGAQSPSLLSGAQSPSAVLGEEVETVMEAYIKTLGNQVEIQCAETLYEVMSGHIDYHLEQLISTRKDGQSLSQMSWCGTDSQIEGLKELERQLCLHKSCINAASADAKPPATGARTLKRLRSEAEDQDELSATDKERSELWVKLQKDRRKYIKVTHFQGELGRDVKAHLEQSVDGLSAGSGHRLVTVAADASWECESKPWFAVPEWRDDVGTIATRMLQHRKEVDVVIAHDGRSRTVRRELEDIYVAHAKHWVDMWMTFTPVQSKGRKVFMGANNREAIFVELPTPRNTWAVEAVTEFQGAGEQDTHASTLTGVDPLTWWQMPLISEVDKKQVMGHAVQKPSVKCYDATMGQPLMWNERKTMAYWRSVVKRFKIKKVINFSPGCGMLERVCLEQGIPCTAVCRNATHANWLLNVLDRACMAAIVTKGTAVYDAEIKANVERLFQDMLERLRSQDNDENEMPTPDEDGF